MSHTAEIIAVGTELLLGNITNTNASEISRALSAVGVNVFWHTVVGDNPERLREALDIARKRADVILTTGGLGPTYDDLTKQTVCETFGKPLVLREDVLEHIRTYFARNVHLTMPENTRQQAEFPADCVIFDNPVGTAPGCAFEAEGVHVLMLPGPPFEMRTMLQNWAVPYLRGLSKEVIVSHDIMTFGLGESPMEDLMRERISRMENPSLATYAKPKDGTPAEAADEVYRAVFHPEGAETRQTAARTADGAALTELRNWRDAEPLNTIPPAGEDPAPEELETMDLVLYSDEDLPENVSMRQAILGFDHETPVKGVLSSNFGYRDHPLEGTERFHYGVDLAADTGTAIACFADGTVTAVGESSSYGKYCTVTHANGCATLYAHCGRISVSSGAAVKKGEKLGEVGETGMATGPHLHFELQKDGVYLNPIYYVETA